MAICRPVAPWILALLAALAVWGPAPSAPAAPGGNWPQFRGPNRDLVSAEKGLLARWPAEGPHLLWRAAGMGEGYSSVVVAGGRIYTQGHKGNQEHIVILDEATGALIRSVPVGPAGKVDKPGSRAVPTVDGDLLLVETVAGDVVCLRKSDLKELWRKNLAADFKGEHRSMFWGYSESPLVDGDRVIVTPGGAYAAIVALEKRTGATLWRAQVPEGNLVMYASPVAGTVDGVRQYVQFLMGGVVGVRATDGKLLWMNSDSTCERNNIATPLFWDRYVFSSAGYDKGKAALVEIGQGGETAKLVYSTSQLKNQLGGFVRVGDYLYGATDPGSLVCLEWKTGRVAWKERSTGKVNVLYADGHLYMRNEGGAVILAEANPEAYREAGRFMPPDRSPTTAWSYPVVAGGRLYLRDQDVLLCYDVGAR